MANPGPLRLGLEIEAVFVPKASDSQGKPLEPGQFAAELAESYSGTPGMHTNYERDYTGHKYVEWEIVKDVSLRKDPTNRTCKSISHRGRSHADSLTDIFSSRSSRDHIPDLGI
jgi:hypothetical protein